MKLISLTFENSKFEGLEINGNFLLGKNIHRTFSVKKMDYVWVKNQQCECEKKREGTNNFGAA